MAKILVIEDHKPSLDALVTALTALGHEVAGFEHGGFAVTEACTAETPFDMVLTDGQIPGESGPSVIRILREIGYPTTPIIASSSDDSLWWEFSDDPNVHTLKKPLGPGPHYVSIWNVEAAVALAQKLLKT